MNVAVVTGAGRGLGREIARALADKGFAVLVTDIDEASARATAELIGGDAWSIHQDVRLPESHYEVARAATARGSVRLWVNNAGILYAGHAWQHDDGRVRQMVEVNVLGMIWGSRAGVAAMRDEGGQLINIASISALAPAPGLAVYGATKHAALGFSTSLAGDLRREGIPIQVSVVCPHGIDTEMVRDIRGAKESNLVFAQPKLLTVEGVAKTVVELVDRPRLVVTMPKSYAMLAHLLRPFPGLALSADKPMSWLGDRQRRKTKDGA